MVRDMTSGSVTKNILMFCVPLLLGNVCQELYNMVDTAVVGQGVGLYRNHITELPVDSPGIKAFRNLLVFLGRIVVVFVEILVFTASRDGSVFIDLVIRTFGLCGSSERSEE